MNVIAKPTGQVIEIVKAGEKSLAERAEIINRKHGEVEGHLRGALACAFDAGDELLAAKAEVPFGEFQEWVEQAARLTVRHAQRYMKLAASVSKTTRASFLDEHTSIRQALAALDAQDDSAPRRYWILEDWKRLLPARREKIIANAKDGSSVAFNRQEDSQEEQAGNIEWAKWSWNPVTGCEHDCSYCYARDISNRFPQAYPPDFTPAFWPDRLAAPANTHVPDKAVNDIGLRNVFTCSMADLFGRWVPADWIEAVISEVRANPQWNFLFLTKFPKRLTEFEWPDNAWLGTTVDLNARVKAAEDAFSNVKAAVKWLSVEPMIERLNFTKLDMFDWIVMGGASKSTQTPEWRPPLEWVMELRGKALDAGCRVYMKTNLLRRERYYPGQDEILPERAPDEMFYLGRKSQRS